MGFPLRAFTLPLGLSIHDDATAVRPRSRFDYLFTMIDVATVCIPLYVRLPRYLFAVIHTCVLGKWNDT